MNASLKPHLKPYPGKALKWACYWQGLYAVGRTPLDAFSKLAKLWAIGPNLKGPKP